MNDSTKISEIKAEIIALRKKADNMEKALQLLFGKDVMLVSQEDKQEMPALVITENPVNLHGTFFNKVNSILSANGEMKGKDIHAYMGDMPYNSFSAQLSTLVKNGKINKRVVENASNSDKYFYHL